MKDSACCGVAVDRPMDLLTIKKNIDSGLIRTTAEFQRDMMLMFINAMMYNNVEHDVHKMAVEMYSDVMMHIEVGTLSLAGPGASPTIYTSYLH